MVWRQFATAAAAPMTDSVVYNVSHDCGKTFDNKPHVLADFIHFDAQDQPGTPTASRPANTPTGDVGFEGHLAPSGSARDCGDSFDSCKSGFTFFRQDSQVRATADEKDSSNTVYVVYNASKDAGSPTGSTYGTISPGIGSQGAVYFTTIRNGVPESGRGTIVDNQPKGHQFFPDISARAGKIHVIWWDNRLDPSYSRSLPIGNTEARTNSGDFLNVFGTSKSESPTAAFPTATSLSTVGTNGNWEQFDGRRVPFAGDYLWVTTAATGASYVVWTDWRNTVPGVDPRPFEADERTPEGFDVWQCRTAADGFATDNYPTAGGKDQNIYGAAGN